MIIDKKLNDYIDLHRKSCIDYVKFDCARFAAGWLDFLNGTNISDLLTYRNKKEAYEIVKDNGGFEKHAIKVMKDFGYKEKEKHFITCGDIAILDNKREIFAICLGNVFVMPKAKVGLYFNNFNIIRGWACQLL